MTPTPTRRRAPGMSQEERRKMIVAAVLPLVIEHGASVTTSQIARAAGIGEGTIFRAFKDKDELIEACVAEALRPDHALDMIAEIPLDQPLHQRLAEAAEALSAHLERMGALMTAMHASGRAPVRKLEHSPRPNDRRASLVAMREAVAELFEPEREALRLPAEKLGAIFLFVLFTRSRDDQDPLSTSDIVDVFLHGALA